MPDRFWSKVDKHGPRARRLGRCWLWTGARNPAGYGTFKIAGRVEKAHRVAWGDVPAGMDVLHHCDNPPCVRRSHLFLGTDFDNQRDAVAKGRHRSANTGKTHCPAGHPYDEKNTYVWHGSRYCRACIRLRTVERRRAA